jgi:hypothetical protein
MGNHRAIRFGAEGECYLKTVGSPTHCQLWRSDSVLLEQQPNLPYQILGFKIRKVVAID